MTAMAPAGSAQMWANVESVRNALSGPAWGQRFTGGCGLPGWLVQLVDGHAETGSCAGLPVLFRTAGIGTGWAAVSREHPGQLQLVWRGGESAPVVAVIEELDAADAIVDADVYVLGDGGSRYTVQVHRVFGVFQTEAARDAAAADYPGFLTRCYLGRDGFLLEVAPRLLGGAVR